MSKNLSSFLLSISGALLLWLAWPTSPLTLLIFIAWVPLLLLANKNIKNSKFILLSLLHMMLWNVLTTWWLINSTMIGGISAFIVNSILMTIPWTLYFIIQKRSSFIVSSISFIVLWLSFEFLHSNWDLSWPWLTLGNAFSMQTGWIQWYEYTGVSGGSLWILLSNLFVFSIIKNHQENGRNQKYFIQIICWMALLFIPITISKFIKFDAPILHNKYNVVVVQPNINPYTTKFDASTQDDQIKKLVALSEKNIDENTALVIWPETALPFYVDENDVKNNPKTFPIWDMLQKYPQVNLVSGVEGVRYFDHKNSVYAKQIQGSNEYYESYNSASLWNKDSVTFYHKSKLVPGVEVLPSIVRFMAPVFEKFGGTTGGYARDTKARVFHSNNNHFTVAPAVCYESVYGDFMTQFLKQDANIIAIITNDGWWGNTEGHKQHMSYAKLRAIESRKWVARSANTGTSCFINPYGKVVQQLDWDKEGALKQQVQAFSQQSFYTQHGDIISRIMAYASIIVITYFFYLLYINKKKNARK
ncbi:MAG: apolipoprotein N-acyltransferase [Chitinophagaceae bacterium]|nr:MAG: apolipoprotein N-acyltransferase [Chitinophagaceae bacterium]